MLARARNAPLDINIDLDGVPDPKVLLVFFPHLSHTRELRLSALDLRHLDSVQGICSQEVPALEHFEVEVSPIILRSPSWSLMGQRCSRGELRSYGRFPSSTSSSPGHSFLVAN
jgi:hypothetical protein